MSSFFLSTAAVIYFSLASSSSSSIFAHGFTLPILPWPPRGHFHLPSPSSSATVSPTQLYGKANPAKSDPKSNKDDKDGWLEDFRLFTGEIVNPYEVLKVSREAEKAEIRQQYLKMSKRYHPDAARQRDIFPGSCNNEDDVRDEWERIKFSYEILTDKRMRKKYDRHEVIADPQAAMKRAAMDAAGKAASGLGKGVFSVGKGIFSMGAKVVSKSVSAGAQAVSESIDKTKKEEPKTGNDSTVITGVKKITQELQLDDTAASTPPPPATKGSSSKAGARGFGRQSMELPMFFASKQKNEYQSYATLRSRPATVLGFQQRQRGHPF